MNERIKKLAEQAAAIHGHTINFSQEITETLDSFALLIKQAIYDDVKQELMDDDTINYEIDPLNREYLKGCNGGTVDALCHIKNFGVDIEL